MIDRDAAIRNNRAALWKALAEMFALLGVVMGARVPLTVLPDAVTRRLRLLVLETLRPAESALRRLIVTASHGIVVAPRKDGGGGGGFPAGGIRRVGAKSLPCFPLYDRRKRVGPPPQRLSAPGEGPSVTRIGMDRHVVSTARRTPEPEDELDAAALLRRLLVLRRALDRLPQEARRLARVMASGRAKWPEPMRPGRPPGHRQDGKREIDEVLRDCHLLALWTLRPPRWWSDRETAPP